MTEAGSCSKCRGTGYDETERFHCQACGGTGHAPPDNVVKLGGRTTQDIPVEDVLSGAMEANFESVVVIGVNADGYFSTATSDPDITHLLYLLERAKHKLMLYADGEED